MGADELRRWDANQDFAFFVARYAGLHAEKDVVQEWVVGGCVLTVEWALDRRAMSPSYSCARAGRLFRL